MAVSVFDNKAVTPDDDMISNALAEAYPFWVELQNYVKENYPSVTGVWKHYGKSSGWVFKLLSKKRNLLFLIPRNGCFRLRFGVSEKAAPLIEGSDLPDEVKEAVRIATPYTEGRSIDLDLSASYVNVMAYVKDRQIVDIGTVDGEQLELTKRLIQITNQA